MRYQSENFPIKMLITQEFNMKYFNKSTQKQGNINRLMI